MPDEQCKGFLENARREKFDAGDLLESGREDKRVDLATYLTWNFPRKVAVWRELELTRFFGSVVHDVDVPRLRRR